MRKSQNSGPPASAPGIIKLYDHLLVLHSSLSPMHRRE